MKLKINVPENIQPYIDFWIIAFSLTMVTAASITSHGTYSFYAYFLPEWLALTATVTLTVGIMLLGVAGMLDLGNRGKYWGGMMLLLFMEGSAQYLQGQAEFPKKVLEYFNGETQVHLVRIVQSDWGWILPAIFLALLSIIVVGFDLAISNRIRSIHRKKLREIARTNQVWVLRLENDRLRKALLEQSQEIVVTPWNAPTATQSLTQMGDAVRKIRMITEGTQPEENVGIEVECPICRQVFASIPKRNGHLASCKQKHT